jgi:putative phosphoesterase
MLKKLKNFRCVLGNHDWAVLGGDTSWFNPWAAEAIKWTRGRISNENLSFIKKLPTKIEFNASGKKFFVTHGSPKDALFEYVYADDARLPSFLSRMRADILIMGHTHVPFVKRFGEKIVLNPGAVGQPRDGDARASYAEIEVRAKTLSARIKRVEYDVGKTAREVTDAGLPRVLAKRLFLGE